MMEIRKLKNVMALIGYVATIICISATPQMVRWYMSMYVIYLVAIWLGHTEDHDQWSFFIMPKLHANMTFIYFTLCCKSSIIIIENESSY